MTRLLVVVVGSSLIGLSMAGQSLAQAIQIPPCHGVPANEQVINQLKARNGRSEVLVQGVVERLLPTDNVGIRHEKFVINVGSIPIYIAHDISIAPAIALKPGDTVTICGEFLPVGPSHALIHWTHHDPQGTHPAGYIVNGNQIVQ